MVDPAEDDDWVAAPAAELQNEVNHPWMLLKPAASQPAYSQTPLAAVFHGCKAPKLQKQLS